MSADREVVLEVGHLHAGQFAVASGREQGFKLEAAISHFAFPECAPEPGPPFGEVSMR